MAVIQQKCCVFIDNSNLFINGQKFYARHKKLRAEVRQDTRFRIDFGQMVHVLLNERVKIYAKLYGSVPPPNDDLWQDIRKQGILVETFDRNSQNYEKEVDTSLTADVTEQSCELHGREPTGSGSVTFIVIAGDRDYLPCYDKVLKRNWKLEIAAWKTCLSQKVQNFAQTNSNRGVSLVLLDNLVVLNPDIYYVADRWRDQKQKRLPRDRTIVFEYKEPVEERDAKNLSSDVTDLIKFPCCYKYRAEKDAKIVMIIIIPNQKEGNYSTGILYEGLKAKFSQRCKRIVDFVSFIQEKNPKWQKYKDFEEEDEEESTRYENDFFAGEGEGGGDESGDDDFTVVSAKRRKLKHTFSAEKCRYRFACRNGESCRYVHTEAEKEHFKNHPQKLGKLYKAKFCCFAVKDKCQNQQNPKQCRFAHDKSEARCYNCEPGGLEGVHWMDECPNKRF